MINIAKLLNKSGFEVDIYTSENSKHPAPGKIGDKTKIKLVRSINDAQCINIILQTLRNIKLWAIAELIEILFFIFQVAFLKKGQPYSSQNQINIGVDKKGSILCLLEYYLFNRKFIYLSLEIYPSSAYGKLAAISTNPIACLAYRKAEIIVVQDEDRFKSISEYHHYDHPRVFYLPNSPIDSKTSTSNERDNYFREMLNSSHDKSACIIAHTGMICDLVYCNETAKVFTSIKCNNYVLVFHSSEKREVDEPYIKELRKINSRNLLLSLNPLPYDEIDTIFMSTTIGLVFYKGINNNFSQIAMASGKLANYLKHGKPVLVSNLESLSRLVHKYKIGIVIQDQTDAVEIESAINTILENYSVYSKNARRCFEVEYDFERKAESLLSHISIL